jgi:hypothetical protein
MPADSRLGTVRAARSCNAAQINSAIAAAVKTQDRIVQEMMIDPPLNQEPPSLSQSHFQKRQLNVRPCPIAKWRAAMELLAD